MTDKLPVALSTVLAIVLAIALALVAGPAAALGLGQITVKSPRNQPLVAEIPIISNDPSELNQLQVRLASPETFRRIGMDPSQGVAAALQFAVALDTQGRPVIRVTSAVPVQQSLLTFLIEVDWGQGRLVREYSALLDAPRTVSAPLPPAIQAPTVAPPNTIVRPVPAPVAAVPVPQPAVPPPVVAQPPVPVVPAPQPEPAPATAAIPIPPPPTAAPVAVPAAAAPLPTPIPQRSGEYGPVQRGETLSQIAGRMQANDGYSLDQTMLALLRANPDAFIGDNINLIKQGVVLRAPQPSELAQLDATQAAVVVRDHIQQWRQAQRPLLQPAVADSAVASTTSSPTGTALPVGGSRNRPRIADARLAIVAPTSSSGRRAGTRSGIQTGGEGDMLRQELVQTKETLAARSAEVEELKARVADLEKLQQQQQQLITLKDSELAAAQQRLAASSGQTATTQTTATEQAATPPPDTGDRGNGMVWLWAALALLVLVALAWWLTQRRRPREAPSRAFDSQTLAANMPTAAPPTVADARTAIDRPHLNAQTAPSSALAAEPGPTPTAAAQWEVPPGAAPTWHAGSFDPNGTAVADTTPAANERLQLARAYLDLGDDDAARTLLREVLDGSDPAARAEATRLLRDLN